MDTHQEAMSTQTSLHSFPFWAGTTMTRREAVNGGVAGLANAMWSLMSRQCPAEPPRVQGADNNKPDTDLLWKLTKFLSLATQ